MSPIKAQKHINTTETILIDGKDSNINTGILGNILQKAEGNASNIELNTASLTLIDGGRITASIFGKGNAGTITINATDGISLDGKNSKGISSIISSLVNKNAVGSAGAIRINTKNLSLKNGARINSNTLGEGNANIVYLNAINNIFLDDSIISASGNSNSIGNSGKVDIQTNNLSLKNGSRITASNFGNGNAGDITINATNDISLQGLSSNASSNFIDNIAGEKALGNGGDIRIYAKNLLLNDGASITSSTLSEGDAGSLIVRASDLIELSGFSANSRSGLRVNATEGSGNGGNLEVFTNQLILRDGATISASNFSSIEGFKEAGTGKAGNLDIEANSIILENEARINVSTETGNGGNINLKINEELILRNNSFIAAQASQNSTGGNIKIDAGFIIAFSNQNNDIIASAETGKGGNIRITANGILGIQERDAKISNNTNDIDASSEFGSNGKITINRLDTDSIQSLTKLPLNVIDGSKLITQGCLIDSAEKEENEFIVTGRGGLPHNPHEFLRGNALLSAEWVSLSQAETKAIKNNSLKVEQPIKEIIEAQGWVIDDTGKVILTATSNTKNRNYIPWLIPNFCN